MSNQKSQKRQREKDRAEKAQRKRDKRLSKDDGTDAAVDGETSDDAAAALEPQLTETQVLSALELLHQRFSADGSPMSLDEFEAERSRLTGLLDVR